jgi:hypothetical protein
MLLQKIKAIAAVNKEIIDRLLQRKDDIFVSGYKYEVEVDTKSTFVIHCHDPKRYCENRKKYEHIKRKLQVISTFFTYFIRASTGKS